MSLDKSTSYFDNDEVKNILVAKGEIFNNPLNLNLSNNYLSKNLKLNLGLNKIGKKLKINLNYLGKPHKASIEIISGSDLYYTDLKFNKENIIFSSSEKNSDNIFYEGFINLKPFFSKIKVKILNLDFYELVNNQGVFY